MPVAKGTTVKTAFPTVSGNEESGLRNRSESEVGDDFEALLFQRMGVSPNQDEKTRCGDGDPYWQRPSVAVQLQ